MSNFNYWYNNIADMPERDSEGWYDLETGLRYDPSADYIQAKPRAQVSQKTKNARNIAKFFGGTGTTAIAAHELNIDCTIIEIDKNLCEKTAKILKFLGAKIEKINF